MIIDSRYHLVSMVAVFLALGIGILIGGAILGNNALQQQLTAIEQDLNKMRDDQHALEAEISGRDLALKTYNQFSAEVMPALIRNQLLGKRIALIRTNPNTDPKLVKDISRILQSAGARVTSLTTVLRRPADLPSDKLKALAGGLGIAETDPEKISEAILRLAAEQIADGPGSEFGNGPRVVNSLAAAKLLELSGNYDDMVDALILVGGSRDPNQDTSQKIDRILLDGAAGVQGLTIAAVEPETIERSYLSEYIQHQIIIVDNVDTIIGETALVLSLVRGKRGHYGVKGTRQLLPDIS